jgi:hypothetical protein
MVKNILLAAALAVSMITVPQTATAATAASSGCGLNCVLVSVIDGHGNVLYTYWECEVEMECVEP